jgi:hypothetical protein
VKWTNQISSQHNLVSFGSMVSEISMSIFINKLIYQILLVLLGFVLFMLSCLHVLIPCCDARLHSHLFSSGFMFYYLSIPMSNTMSISDDVRVV